jgi:hypothetical protein
VHRKGFSSNKLHFSFVTSGFILDTHCLITQIFLLLRLILSGGVVAAIIVVARIFIPPRNVGTHEKINRSIGARGGRETGPIFTPAKWPG